MAVSSARSADPAAVLAAAQRGDAAAQAALFDAHKHRVARQVLRMVGDSAVVDDLVQEVFIAAFAALPRFRGEAQIETWLYTIATNKVRNWWDGKRRRDAREEYACREPSAESADPEQHLEVHEHLSRLYAALGELPHKFREAFTARAIEHLSLQEASESLGIPVSTVSYRCRRAEQMLCEALGIAIPGDAQ